MTWQQPVVPSGSPQAVRRSAYARRSSLTSSIGAVMNVGTIAVTPVLGSRSAIRAQSSSVADAKSAPYAPLICASMNPGASTVDLEVGCTRRFAVTAGDDPTVCDLDPARAGGVGDAVGGRGADEELHGTDAIKVSVYSEARGCSLRTCRRRVEAQLPAPCHRSTHSDPAASPPVRRRRSGLGLLCRTACGGSARSSALAVAVASGAGSGPGATSAAGATPRTPTTCSSPAA